MADLLIAIFGIFVFIFGFVIAFGAPYLPTLDAHKKLALKMLALKPGNTMLELGCGDGRILADAAKRGIKCIGYEINPLLVLAAKWQTRKYRHLVKVRMKNYWGEALPEADAIFVFLLPKYMKKLDKKITQEISKPVKLISVAFEIPGRKPTKQKNGLFLYEYKNK
jgi:SAM-dependent methyltransferase